MKKVVGAAAVLAAAACWVPAPANADTAYDAMAYSPSTNVVGWGTGATRQAAQDAAYTQCSANTDDCAWAAYSQGECLAVVSNGPNDWGGGHGATEDAAVQDANQSKGGTPGQVVAVKCLTGGGGGGPGTGPGGGEPGTGPGGGGPGTGPGGGPGTGPGTGGQS